MTEIDDALANVAVWECRVGSWLGGRFLGLVPFTSGSITWSKSRDVMGSLELEVPPMVDGVSWVPGNDPKHPLAKFGQELTVDITVTDPGAPRVGGDDPCPIDLIKLSVSCSPRRRG